MGKEPEHPLPAGFLCLCSENALVFVLGIAVLGVCHYTLTVKGSHLATHGALTESKRWSRIWALFFVEVSAGGGGGWAAAGTMGVTSLSMPAGVTDTAGILVQGLGLTPGSLAAVSFAHCLWREHVVSRQERVSSFLLLFVC